MGPATAGDRQGPVGGRGSAAGAGWHGPQGDGRHLEIFRRGGRAVAASPAKLPWVSRRLGRSLAPRKPSLVCGLPAGTGRTHSAGPFGTLVWEVGGYRNGLRAAVPDAPKRKGSIALFTGRCRKSGTAPSENAEISTRDLSASATEKRAFPVVVTFSDQQSPIRAGEENPMVFPPMSLTIQVKRTTAARTDPISSKVAPSIMIVLLG